MATLKDMAHVLTRPYTVSEMASLTLVDKMEIALYPTISMNANDDAPLWEVALLRQGIPKEWNDQLTEKINSAEYLIEHGGSISAVLGGSSFPGTILCNDFRKADGPTVLTIYSFLGFSPNQYVKTGSCGDEDCRLLRCPFCAPRLRMAIAIEARFTVQKNFCLTLC